MSSIANNKPQDLADSQWLLTWQEMSSTDKVLGHLFMDRETLGEEIQLFPAKPGSRFDEFMRPDEESNSFLLDLERVPTSVFAFEFFLEVKTNGNRSWHLEGLNTGESLQSLSTTVFAGGLCKLLRIEKSDDGWKATALADQESVSGPENSEQDTVDDREKWAQSTGQTQVIIDMTASMHQLLANGLVETTLAALQNTTSKANRELTLSFHGAFETTVSDTNSLSEVLQKGIHSASQNALSLKPLHSLIPNFCRGLAFSTDVFVVSEALFFIDEEIDEDLAVSESRLTILLLTDENPTGSLPESTRVKLRRLTANPEVTVDELSEML